MKESQKKAFDFASESTKLLISLSTGVIALTITFAKDFIGDTSQVSIWPLVTAWILYFFSIVFGVFTMLSLTGSLSPAGLKPEEVDGHEENLSIYEANITFKSGLQLLTFLLALLFTIVFGFTSMQVKDQIEKDKMETRGD